MDNGNVIHYGDVSLKNKYQRLYFTFIMTKNGKDTIETP